MKTTVRMMTWMGALAVMILPLPAGAIGLGDQAPRLQVDHWISGAPLLRQPRSGGSVYVIEFWATWCPPCRTSIPHLSELQRRYSDVIFVGVTSEDPRDVRSFIRDLPEKVAYRMRLYTPGEMRKMFARAGMVVDEVYGSYDGSAFDPADSPHTLYVARRPAR